MMPPASPPQHLSNTEIRVSKLVPCLAKAAPDTAPVKHSCADSVRLAKVSTQAGTSGAKLAPVMATSRPLGASHAKAERMCWAVAVVLAAIDIDQRGKRRIHQDHTWGEVCVEIIVDLSGVRADDSGFRKQKTQQIRAGLGKFVEREAAACDRGQDSQKSSPG